MHNKDKRRKGARNNSMWLTTGGDRRREYGTWQTQNLGNRGKSGHKCVVIIKWTHTGKYLASTIYLLMCLMRGWEGKVESNKKF